jgi:CubicO group peptidase (beta-lactamase class C family)
MKTRISVFILLFLCTALIISIASIFSPTRLAQKRIYRSTQSQKLDERIRRVENGLLLPFIVKGEPNMAMKLVNRMRFYKIPGVSVGVINNGKIEWAHGYGVQETGKNKSITPETLFQAASISKPIVAMAMLRLVQENKLKLDEDVNKKLISWKVPENDFTKEQKVTLRGLLSHSASLTVSGFRGYAVDEQVPSLFQILDGATPANSIPIRVDSTPNKDFRYAGGGYVVVQKLAEDATKKPFPSFMQEAVLKKLNMIRSTYQQPLPKKLRASAAAGHKSDGEKIKGNWHTYPEMAAAGLWTTPSDLARFAIEIQKSKSGKSNRVLSVEMVNEMLTPQIGGWGLGLELRGKNKSARFAHAGGNEGYRCLMVAYTDSGQGAVVMTNSVNGTNFTEEIMRSIAKEYGWFEYLPKEKVIVSVEPKIYDIYAGQYQIAPNFILTITNEKGKLMSQATGQPKSELFAESETDFFLKESETEIKFVKNTQGKVTGLVSRERERDTPAQKIK